MSTIALLIYDVEYLGNRQRLDSKGPPIGNGLRGIKRSHERWYHNDPERSNS